MAKHTPLSILMAFYEAELKYMEAPVETKDFNIIATTLTEDVKLIQTDALPYPGIFHGRQGFQDWAVEMNKWFSTVDVRDQEIFVSQKEESNQIIVKSRVRFVVRKTGEELHYPLVQAVKVDLEKGQISEMQPFYWDVTGLNKAIGYTPSN